MGAPTRISTTTSSLKMNSLKSNSALKGTIGINHTGKYEGL